MSNRQLELFDDLITIIDGVEYKYSTKYDMHDDKTSYDVTILYDESKIQFDVAGVEVPKKESLSSDKMFMIEIAQMQKSLYTAYERIKELSEELAELKQGKKDA